MPVTASFPGSGVGAEQAEKCVRLVEPYETAAPKGFACLETCPADMPQSSLPHRTVHILFYPTFLGNKQVFSIFLSFTTKFN